MPKIITLNADIQELIQKAKNGNRLAQKQLYDRYAGAMLSVSRLYISDLHFAEDVLLKAFLKVFLNLKKYEEKEHFYAWIRRIMVNECLDFLRSKQQKMKFSDWDDNYDDIDQTIDNEQLTDEFLLQQLIDELPSGARAVFNLFVFEDYSHEEISKELKISVGTSKSQLSYAKKMLKEKFSQLKNKKI